MPEINKFSTIHLTDKMFHPVLEKSSQLADVM